MEFGEIVKHEPFTTNESVVTFADLDGVFFKYGKESSTEANIKRLRGLANVISKSDEFVFWSSRIRVDEESNFWKFIGPLFDGKSVSYFPFMTDRSTERMESFARNINPNCEVSSKIGLKKMRSCFGLEDDFTEMSIKALEKQKKLVVIGSSMIDRHRVEKLASEIKNKHMNLGSLFYFDTGHIIL